MLQTRHAPAAVRARARARRRPGARPRARGGRPRARRLRPPRRRPARPARCSGCSRPGPASGRSADGIRAFLDPARLVFARTRKPAESLWAAEEALRTGEVPLVVADLPAPPALLAVRRLHLAAEAGARSAGRPLALLLTPGSRRRARASRPAGSLAPAPGWATRRRPALAPHPRPRPHGAGGELAGLARGRPAPPRPGLSAVHPRPSRRGPPPRPTPPRSAAAGRPTPCARRRPASSSPRIREDAAAFLAALEDETPRDARSPCPTAAGSPRLPWLVRWMWDGELAGSINLRWPRRRTADAAARPRPHRLRRRPLEAAARPCHPRPRAPPAGSAGARPRLRRAHHRAGEHSPRNGSSRRTAAGSSSASRRPPPTAAAPRCATASTSDADRPGSDEPRFCRTFTGTLSRLKALKVAGERLATFWASRLDATGPRTPRAARRPP